MGKRLDEARAALSLTFAAVNSASDAYPPLKNVSGGLVFFVQLAQTVQSNKRDYAELLTRIAGIAQYLVNGDESQSSSGRTDVGFRVDAFRRCLEKLRETLEDVNPRGRHALRTTLRANQHKEIIRSCNEELDRFTRDFGVWANIWLMRNADSIRQRPTTLTDADLASVTVLLAQQLSSISFKPLPLPPDPPDPPPDPSKSTTESSPNPSASSFYFSASSDNGVNVKLNLHIRPATCVLFAYGVRGGGL